MRRPERAILATIPVKVVLPRSPLSVTAEERDQLMGKPNDKGRKQSAEGRHKILAGTRLSRSSTFPGNISSTSEPHSNFPRSALTACNSIAHSVVLGRNLEATATQPVHTP
jgi:hypothetical protein